MRGRLPVSQLRIPERVQSGAAYFRDRVPTRWLARERGVALVRLDVSSETRCPAALIMNTTFCKACDELFIADDVATEAELGLNMITPFKLIDQFWPFSVYWQEVRALNRAWRAVFCENTHPQQVAPPRAVLQRLSA